MKKFIVMLLAALLVFSVPAAAKQVDNFSIDINEEQFAVLARGEISQKKELVESLGYTTKSLTKYFTDNDLILFATNSDKSRQVQVKCAETEFTRQLSSLATLENQKLLDIADKILPQEALGNYLLINKGDVILYQFTVCSSDSGGKFCNRQYITISGGKLYSIGFFESGEQLSAEFASEIDAMMNSLKIKRDEKLTARTAEDITVMVIIWALIAIAAAIAGWMLYSLVRETIDKNKGEPTEVINRRKY